MARKIQFDITDAAPTETTPAPRPEPGSRAPSLSGMARSLHAAAAASIREIDPVLIDDSQFKDRIADDDDSIAELAESIRAQGQLIPILVSPTAGGRFRIVYGRRRLAALRLLAQPAKALVRDLDEDQAILAQGQENTFRRDLSWIEKAVFARQLLDAGKTDALICDTLNIDQKARRAGDKLTGLSRMKQVTAKLSPALIDAVGPAPGVGRDRWYDLAQMMDRKGFPPGNQQGFAADLLADPAEAVTSDARFAALEQALRRVGKAVRPAAEPASALGTVRVSARSATITVTSKDAADLHRWIVANPEAALAALHEAQKRTDPQQ